MVVKKAVSLANEMDSEKGLRLVCMMVELLDFQKVAMLGDGMGYRWVDVKASSLAVYLVV